MKPIRLCFVVTVDITLLNLCRGRFEYLRSRGFEVSAVCAPTLHAEEIQQRGVRLFSAPLTRNLTPFQDLRAIFYLYRLFRREQFDLVEVSTPKAALIGSVAAWLARVPRVVHLLRGLVYDGQRGWRKNMLRYSQIIPSRLAHQVISVSPSLMMQAVSDGLCSAERIRVLGNGGSNGVDTGRFRRDSALRERIRNDIGIPPDAVVAGFVGRMTGDKGISELLSAYNMVGPKQPNLFLMLVGDYEHRDRPPLNLMNEVKEHPRIRHVGWQPDTVPYFSAMDLLVHPSHREGLATVLLEAASMGLPIVTTDTVGCRDAVKPETTALVVPARDPTALAGALSRLTDDAVLRDRLGSAGRRHVEASFAQEVVWQQQEAAFRSLLKTRNPGAARE